MRTQRTSVRRWSALILVLFCTAGMHQGGAAQVLCIGEDGHVEIEMPQEGCCDDSANARAADLAASIAPEDVRHENECGACIDIPIVASSQIAVKSVSVDRIADTAVSLTAAVPVLTHGQIARASADIIRSGLSPTANATLPLLR